MQAVTIDEEFKCFLPKLDKATYESLEANLMENGCRDPLVLWEGILIDGYNRYEICTRHGIPFSTVSRDFASRENALVWIIRTQLSRRNLSPLQLSHYRGEHYKMERKIIKNQGGKNQYSEEEVTCQNGKIPLEQWTVARLAKQYKVSPRTISRDAKTAGAIDAIGETSSEARQRILAGDANISKRELERLSSKPNEEIAEVAALIENGAYEKKKVGPPAPQGPGRGIGPVLSGMQSLEGVIGGMVDGIESEPPGSGAVNGMTDLATALRSFIDRLEGLYTRIQGKAGPGINAQ
jgi:hypothetical protein